MQSLEEILYAPLQEETTEQVAGWEKETIAYVLKHESKTKRFIRSIAKGMNKLGLQTQDVDDIYSESLYYLYTCSDYNINKAIERSTTGTPITLEGYVNNCLKYCVLRFLKNKAKNEKDIVPNSSNSDGDDKELSIFDTIADTRATIDVDDFEYDLEDVCRSCEPLRYRFGSDLFLIMYVRLLTIGSKQEKFKEILEVLGITKYELSQFDYNSEDSVVLAMTKAISSIDTTEALSVLEEYVFAAKTIKEAILAY